MSGSRVVALCGGIGGAKLALGLYHALAPTALDVVVNTGDDFEHLGLAISPDVDTVLYTLAGLANPHTGWGRCDETWTFMRVLEELGGPAWFRLGDGDLALHVERTRRLAAGDGLAAIVADAASRFGVTARVLPMSDDPVRTLVDTDEGTLAFQHYFVGRRCEVPLRGIRFAGADSARVLPAVLRALAAPDTGLVVLCPSNPYLSVDPMLALPALRAALLASRAPVVAVSPIVGGDAVKGPTAKIMRELGVAVSPASVARHYAGLLAGFVLDRRDAALAVALDVPVCVADTLMSGLDSKLELARSVLAFGATLQTARCRVQAAV